MQHLSVRRTAPLPLRALTGLLLLVALVLSATSCGSDEAGQSGAPTPSSGRTVQRENGGAVGVTEFAALVARPGVTVVDVRTPTEFAAGHLPGAVNIDVEGAGFDGAVAALGRAGTYAVYCHSGSRSAVAAARMVGLGFTSITQLGGGILAWTAAGRSVTTS